MGSCASCGYVLPRAPDAWIGLSLHVSRVHASRCAVRACIQSCFRRGSVVDSHVQSVVVLEDDAELRDHILVPGLIAFGFNAIGVESAMALYRLLSIEPHSVFVVDAGLPDADGFQVVEHLRKRENATIVMLTGRRSSADHVRGLENGADMYLTKPVSIDVLATALQTLVRRTNERSHAAQEATLRTGSWELGVGGWSLVSPEGETIALSLAERTLVMKLYQSREHPVQREELIVELSGVIEDFDPNRLEMLIHRLRKKVVERLGAELPLYTIRRAGYFLKL